MSHRFQCVCGTVAGEIAEPRRAMRAVCYCRDCRAYAHLLGHPERVLDALGGTDIVATHSKHVRFTQGAAALACLSLSPRGLLRWYASCCDTPIANTPRDAKLPYAGFVHTCLERPDPLERSFPRVEMRVNTKSALATPPRDNSVRAFARFAAMVARLATARWRGDWRASPFFDAQGQPVAPVRVADRAAVEAARQAGRA